MADRSLRKQDALQELEFVPSRVEMRDLVLGRFQLGFQIENLRARFRIKIRRGKSFQIRNSSFTRAGVPAAGSRDQPLLGQTI